MITQENRIEIRDLVQEVLNENHDNSQKRSIDKGSNYLRFACPRCGDSEKNPRKKRGNIFFDSGFYHCYNCGWHTNIIKFFGLFNKEIDDVHIRINVRKTVNDYIESGISKKITTINQETIDKLKEYAIKKQDLMDLLMLRPIFPTHDYVKSKNLMHKTSQMAYKNGNVYFFNMIDDEYTIGFQIRTSNPKFANSSKYIKYPISKIYEKFFKNREVEDPVFLASLDKISLIYNLLNVDFNQTVTVFEGASDSWLYPNSIGKSSVGVEADFLDDVNTVRYFFDNDKDGYKKQAEKVKAGKKVFMWKKFIDDNRLWEYEIKDWADIIALSKTTGRPLFKEVNKYFSNQSLDLIYV